MLNIVLLEPQIPQNTGNISRTCAVTGARLHLVEPMGFKITQKEVKRAGLDYWDMLDITHYASTEEFFEKNKGETFYYFTTKGRHIYSDVDYPENAYLVFGREDKGIDENILSKNEKNCVRLPMISDARSLNLSNTVAIAAYEFLRQKNFKDLQTVGELHHLKWDK